jgi:hypothetical protein
MPRCPARALMPEASANHNRDRDACYPARRPMSDIKIEFDWYVFPLIAVMIGWPGMLIGGVAGGVLWRRHRLIGTLLGAIAGTALWATGEFLWR